MLRDIHRREFTYAGTFMVILIDFGTTRAALEDSSTSPSALSGCIRGFALVFFTEGPETGAAGSSQMVSRCSRIEWTFRSPCSTATTTLGGFTWGCGRFFIPAIFLPFGWGLAFESAFSAGCSVGGPSVDWFASATSLDLGELWSIPIPTSERNRHTGFHQGNAPTAAQ